jgi:hypothetical protein
MLWYGYESYGDVFFRWVIKKLCSPEYRQNRARKLYQERANKRPKVAVNDVDNPSNAEQCNEACDGEDHKERIKKMAFHGRARMTPNEKS